MARTLEQAVSQAKPITVTPPVKDELKPLEPSTVPPLPEAITVSPTKVEIQKPVKPKSTTTMVGGGGARSGARPTTQSVNVSANVSANTSAKVEDKPVDTVPSWKQTLRVAGEDSPVAKEINKRFAMGTAQAAHDLPDLDVRPLLDEAYRVRVARDEIKDAVPELANGGLEQIEKFLKDPNLGESYVKKIAGDSVGGVVNPAKVYLDIQAGLRPDLKEKLDLATRTSDAIINDYAKKLNTSPEFVWTAAYQREFPLREYLDRQITSEVAKEADPDTILRGWGHRTGYIPALAGAKVTAVNTEQRYKQAEDAALRAVNQFDYKLDPVTNGKDPIEGTDPQLDGPAKPGETGYRMAQKVIEQYEADGGNPQWWNQFSQTNRGTRYFVLERTKNLLAQWGVKPGDPNHDEKAREALKRAVFELAAAKTVGLWIPPIILPDSLDPNDFSLVDALKPNVEIVGVALRKDGSAHVVRRAESGGAYAMNVIGAAESALSGGIKTAQTEVPEEYKQELAQQDKSKTLAMGRLPMAAGIVAAQKLMGASDEEALAKPLEVADAAKLGILERGNLLESAINSEWAQPEVTVDLTGDVPKIERSGDWKMLVAGAGGLAASIAMPDALGGVGEVIGEAAHTYSNIKDAASVRRAEQLLNEISSSRAAAESLMQDARKAVDAGDVEAAEKLKAAAQAQWKKAAAAEGTAGPDRVLAQAQALEDAGEHQAAAKLRAQASTMKGTGLRGEFPLIADHLDRMDAEIATKVSNAHPEIFDTALAEGLPFQDAEKAKLTLHPSDRRAQLEYGPKTRGQLEYSRLYDAGGHRLAFDELEAAETAELKMKRLSEATAEQNSRIGYELSREADDSKLLNAFNNDSKLLYDDPEAWKKKWLSEVKSASSFNVDEKVVRSYVERLNDRKIQELRSATNEYLEKTYGEDIAAQLSPKLSWEDAQKLGIDETDYNRMLDSFENIQTWNHPQYVDGLVADEIKLRKKALQDTTDNIMVAYRKAKDLRANEVDFGLARQALEVNNETRSAAAALARKQLLDQFQMSGDIWSPIKSSKKAVADAANSIWEDSRLIPTYAKTHTPLLPRIGRFIAQAGAGLVEEARKMSRGELGLGKSGRKFASQLEAAFGISHEEAVAVSMIAEARARTWAAENAGKTVDDWFKEHIADVVGYGKERQAKIKLKLKELAKSDEYGALTKKLVELALLQKDEKDAKGVIKKITKAKQKKVEKLLKELEDMGVEVETFEDTGKFDVATTTERWLKERSAKYADVDYSTLKGSGSRINVGDGSRETDWLEQNQNSSIAQNPEVLQVYRDRANQPVIPGRATGVQAIIDRLTLEIKKNRDAAQLTEKDLGKPRFGQLGPVIDTEDLKDMRWFFDALGIKGEKNLEDVALSIKNTLSGRALGQFHPTGRAVSLSREGIAASTKTAADVLIHEIWHALTPFIPKNTMEELYTQFRREQDVLRAQNPGLFQLESRMSGPGPEQWRLRDNYAKFYGTNVEEANRVYRYASFDEWIAENLREATQKTRNSETAARTSVFDGAANLLDKIADKILAKTGDTSVSPALNTFLKEEQNTQAAARKLATYQAVAGDINARSGQGLFATIQDKLNAAVDYLVKDKTAAMDAAKNSPAVNSRWLFQDATSTVSDAAVGYRPGGLEKIKNAKTAREAAEILATHADDPSYRVIAKKLAEIIDPAETFSHVPHRWREYPGHAGHRQYASRLGATMTPGHVNIFSGEPTSKLVLHELVHSATSNQILRYEEIQKSNVLVPHGGQRYPINMTDSAYAACQDLQVIFEDLDKGSLKKWARANLSPSDMAILDEAYGMTDLHEFVAEALSNPKFQSVLTRIPAVPGGDFATEATNLIAIGKNVWNAFIDKVRIILGLDTIQPSVLDNILEASSRLIDDSVENRKFLEEFNKDQVIVNWLAGEGERLSPKTKKAKESLQEAEEAVNQAREAYYKVDPATRREVEHDAKIQKWLAEAKNRGHDELAAAIKEFDSASYALAMSSDAGPEFVKTVQEAEARLIETWKRGARLESSDVVTTEADLQAFIKETQEVFADFAKPKSRELEQAIDKARDALYEAEQLWDSASAEFRQTVQEEQWIFKSGSDSLRLYQSGANVPGPKGAVQFLEDQRAIIHAFENADVSTALHELGHIIRRDLPEADLKILEDWAEVKDGVWTIDAEEKFARGFERYLYDGFAPTSYLKKTFAKIKNWMREVYAAVTNSPIDVDIPPSVKDVFDRSLGKGSEASKILDKTANTSRVPSASEELSMLAAKAGVHASPETIRQTILSKGSIEFPFPVNGQKTWTVKDLSKLEVQLSHRTEYQMAVDQPQLSLNLKKSQVVEEKPVDILRSKAAETNSMAAKVGLFVMFGGDAEETMRHMPGAVRRNAVDATRAVSGSWADGLHLIAEDDLDNLSNFLGGAPTNFKAGRPVPTSGYNYLSNFFKDYRTYYDSLDERTQTLIRYAVSNQIPERLMNDARVDKALKSALYGKKAPESLDRLITVVGGVPRAAINDGARLAPNEMKLLRLIAEGSGIVKPGEYLPTTLHEFERAVGIAGDTKSTLLEPVSKGVAETSSVLPPADRISVAWGSGEGVDAARATILGLQQIYGKVPSQKGVAMLISSGAKKKGLDILIDSETAVSAADEGIFKAWINGEHLPKNLQLRAEIMAKKFGVNPDFVTVPGNERFIAPRSAVSRVEGLSSYHFDEIRQSQETADLGATIKDAWGSLLRYTHGRMTFGGALVRQTQSFNQIFDHFNGMLKFAGARPAIASSSRWIAQNILALGLWGVEVGRPLHIAQLASNIGGKEKAILEGVRKGIQSGSDRMSQLIGKLMMVSKYRIEVNDILAGGDKVVQVGDRIYTAQDLKDIFQRKGVFGTFAGTVVGKSIERSGAKRFTKFNNDTVEKISNAWERSKKTGGRLMELPVEIMEGIAERERVGAAVTLIECGMDPVHAAELTVSALYDFAGSMSAVDRNMWTKMILPFWAFQKNANMNFVNLLFSPMGAYRMGIVRKMYDRGSELASQILYSQQTDPYGIQPEALPADVIADYWALRYRVESHFGGTDKVPAEVRLMMRGVFADQRVTIDKGQIYNFNKYLDSVFGSGDLDVETPGYQESVRAHLLNTYRAYQPPIDKSAESEYVRDRDTIRITPPIADTGLNEATRRYYDLVHPNHPFSEIIVPENDVVSSYEWFGNFLATGIVLATHVTENVDLFGEEDDGTDFLFTSTPLKVVVDPTRAPLTSDILSWFGSDNAYPKRIDPSIGKLMGQAFGMEYVTVPSKSDPFVTIPGTDMVSAQQADLAQVFHSEKNPGEYPLVATAPMEAQELRMYLPPGPGSFFFYTSPIGEFSEKFLAYNKSPLEDATPYWGEMLRWARGSLGVKTNEVDQGPGRGKQAKAEEVRFDSSTTEPKTK